jgi:nucleoside-diphosphate-sugar epimerase
MTSGTQEKDWIYLDDVVSGLLALLRHPELEPGTTVELGTGEATSVFRVVNKIYQLVDKGGRPLPGVLPGRPGEDARQVADAAMTKALLNWQAAVNLNDGLQRTLFAAANTAQRKTTDLQSLVSTRHLLHKES